jgi:hypothetical protein
MNKYSQIVLLILVLLLFSTYIFPFSVGLTNFGLGGGFGFFICDSGKYSEKTTGYDIFLSIRTSKGHCIIPEFLRNSIGIEARIGNVFYKPEDNELKNYKLSINPYLNLNVFFFTGFGVYPSLGVGAGLLYERFDVVDTKYSPSTPFKPSLDYKFNFTLGFGSFVTERIFFDMNIGLWYILDELPRINYHIFEDIGDMREGYGLSVFTEVIFY